MCVDGYKMGKLGFKIAEMTTRLGLCIPFSILKPKFSIGNSVSKLAISLVGQKMCVMAQEDNKVEREILCKGNRNFCNFSWKRKSGELHLGRSSICAGKFLFDLHVPFATLFQPCEPKHLAKWKAPLVLFATGYCPCEASFAKA